MQMRSGIFGGTFDPPHIAHLILAFEAYYQLKLDRVLFVLTPSPPHKTNRTITPYVHRLEMLEAAVGDSQIFEISSIEIERKPPHFAVDTVILLRDKFPSDEMIYLMGSDSLMDLPDWHKPEKFTDVCDEIGVLVRSGNQIGLEQLKQHIPGVKGKVKIIEAPRFEISSSSIRQRINLGKPYRYFLPRKVYEIITARNLYRDEALL